MIALAKAQVDYALFSNGRSYVVGLGVNPPVRVSAGSRAGEGAAAWRRRAGLSSCDRALSQQGAPPHPHA